MHYASAILCKKTASYNLKYTQSLLKVTVLLSTFFKLKCVYTIV